MINDPIHQILKNNYMSFHLFVMLLSSIKRSDNSLSPNMLFDQCENNLLQLRTDLQKVLLKSEITPDNEFQCKYIGNLNQ